MKPSLEKKLGKVTYNEQVIELSGGSGELCNVSVKVTGVLNSVKNYTITANKDTKQTFNIELSDCDITSFLVNDVPFTNYINDFSNIVFNLDITSDINIVITATVHEFGFG